MASPLANLQFNRWTSFGKSWSIRPARSISTTAPSVCRRLVKLGNEKPKHFEIPAWAPAVGRATTKVELT